MHREVASRIRQFFVHHVDRGEQLAVVKNSADNAFIESLTTVDTVSQLKDLLVLPIWIDAFVQVFCSLGLVHGSWTSFGSSSARNSNFLLTATAVVAFGFVLVFVWTWFVVSTIMSNVLHDVKNCVIEYGETLPCV